jgi:DNA-binding response OmpR family regulator
MAHILVVDDDGGVCSLLEEALGLGGAHRVTCAGRGLEALWAVENDPPDLAIVDAVLPDVPGLRVARRAMERGVPVLLISGHPATCAQLERLGCPCLTKPFRVRDLLARVAALLVDARWHSAHVLAALDRVGEGV